MARILLIGAVVILVMASQPSPVRAYEGPWCAMISVGTGSVYEDCQYSSIEACRPHVLAGNRGFCNPNPRWVGAYPSGANPRGRHKRKAQSG